MFIAREINLPFNATILGSAPSAAEAITRFLPKNLIIIEEDRDHPGHYDAMSADMRQFTVEPEK